MAFFSSPNPQGAAASSTGWGILDGVIGIAGAAGEFWLQKQANDVQIAEARKAKAQQDAETVAAASSIMRWENAVGIVKWIAIGTIGLVLGGLLIKFLSRTVARAI